MKRLLILLLIPFLIGGLGSCKDSEGLSDILIEFDKDNGGGGNDGGGGSDGELDPAELEGNILKTVYFRLEYNNPEYVAGTNTPYWLPLKYYELFMGANDIHQIRMIAVVQNVSEGNIFFRGRMQVSNDEGIYCFNRLISVTNDELSTPTGTSTYFPDGKAIYVDFSEQGTDVNIQELDYPIPGEQYLGVPPGGYVEFISPNFEPNEYIANHWGTMTFTFTAIPYNPITDEEYNESHLDDNAYVMKRYLEHE